MPRFAILASVFVCACSGAWVQNAEESAQESPADVPSSELPFDAWVPHEPSFVPGDVLDPDAPTPDPAVLFPGPCSIQNFKNNNGVWELQRTTFFTYRADWQPEQIEVVSSEGQLLGQRQFVYDENDRLFTWYGSDSRFVWYYYDADGRVTMQESWSDWYESLPPFLMFVNYDEQENVHTFSHYRPTDAGNHEWNHTWEWERENGRVVRLWDVSNEGQGLLEDFDYDEQGRLVSQVYSAGYRTVYTYVDTDHGIEVHLDTSEMPEHYGDVTYVYDSAGNQLSTEGATSRTAYAYNCFADWDGVLPPPNGSQQISQAYPGPVYSRWGEWMSNLPR